jgi:hypothetical protein
MQESNVLTTQGQDYTLSCPYLASLIKEHLAAQTEPEGRALLILLESQTTDCSEKGMEEHKESQ